MEVSACNDNEVVEWNGVVERNSGMVSWIKRKPHVRVRDRDWGATDRHEEDVCERGSTNRSM